MNDEKLIIDLGSNGTITVDSWDGLEGWLENERAQWAWLVRGDSITDPHNWASTVQGAWDNTIQGVRNVRGGGNPLSEAHRGLAAFSNGMLVPSDSMEGDLVLKIRQTAGDGAGSFAYALLKGAVQPGNARTREELLGAILTVIPDIRKSTSVSDQLQRERANYRSSLKSGIARLDQEESVRKSTFRSQIAEIRGIAAKVLRRRRAAWHAVQSAWEERADSAVESIRSVERAYIESMRLQAPVKYWSDKADAHQRRESWAIGRLCIFFPVAVIGMLVAFYEAALVLLAHSEKPGQVTPAALYVIVTGGLALLSTVVFWVGRLLTKLYLSEHHLRNDANERAIMTQTYLALTKESAASDIDRNIILSALFRSAPDGIVKEDGPTDLNLHALLSRFAIK